jgi:hypothetical protein
VPALQAIRRHPTKEVLDNQVLSNALHDVHDHVLEGTDIATPMKLSGAFPPMVSYMVGVGEQAGNLEEMLERVAETYDEEVDIATQKLTSLHRADDHRRARGASWRASSCDHHAAAAAAARELRRARQPPIWPERGKKSPTRASK